MTAMPHATTLYRSYGFRCIDGTWQIGVAGRRYGEVPQRLGVGQRLLLQWLQRQLQIGVDALSDPHFGSRIAEFLVGAVVGDSVSLRLENRPHRLDRPTLGGGFFFDRLSLDAASFPQQVAYCGQASGRGIELHHECGLVRTDVVLAERQGVTVISDIDDTIKLTEVHCRRRMLSRTFLSPFEPIDGMNGLYRDWAANTPVLFQYVSSSPWQLYRPLQEFLDVHGFPVGSMHLQPFSLSAILRRRFRRAGSRGKAAVIAGLIAATPERRFYLVGDSGQQDLLLYAAIAGRSGNSVAGIAIRDLPENPIDGRRLAAAIRLAPHTPIKIFRRPEQLAGWVV